jgi:hypothetical protein
MAAAVLTFLGGLFTLLAVLIPMAANVYRKAKAEGTLRLLILRIFASLNILFWTIGCVTCCISGVLYLAWLVS